MRFLSVVSLVMLCLPTPLLAQHGGGMHGGGGGGHFGGGHAGGFHGGPPSGGAHAGYGGSARPAFGMGTLPAGPGRSPLGPGRLPVGPGRLPAAPGQFSAGPFAGRGGYGAYALHSEGRPGYRSPYGGGHPGYGSPYGGAHPGYSSPYGGGHPGYGIASVSGGRRYGFLHGGRYPFHRSGVGLHFFYPGVGYPAFVDFGFLNPYWNYADLYDQDQTEGLAESEPANSGGEAYPLPAANDGGQPGNPYAAYPSAAQPPSGYGAAPEQGSLQEPGAAQGAPDADQPMVYAPYAYPEPETYPPQPPPRVTVVTLPPPQREEDAVTLFFRDGRPPEQIRNYALTRTSLLLTSPRLREIPLTDLDLELTERVNHAAGVEFRLPQSQ